MFSILWPRLDSFYEHPIHMSIYSELGANVIQ